MEINNNFTRCGKCGRFYNPKTHDSCPYCREGAPGPTGGTVPPTEKAPNGMPSGGVPPTEPADRTYGSQPSGGQGGFSPTEPPYGAQPGRMGGGDFQHTIIGGGLNVDGGVEPVVGWLVCIDGPSRGSDYRLHAGYNYIGREEGDVRIGGDQQISRRNHAMIAFDDVDAVYFVGPSAGRNLIKVNGKTVLNAVELNNYDVITIGTSKLIFVALCGEHFNWGKV
ncbi:MAG TPA: FHA domain-containing protein [Candidatus Scatomorpha merdigallinarum]|nr:FHA domain-containing protein [Candidatus Scatomorpha merdigallinarum]